MGALEGLSHHFHGPEALKRLRLHLLLNHHIRRWSFLLRLLRISKLLRTDFETSGTVHQVTSPPHRTPAGCSRNLSKASQAPELMRQPCESPGENTG
jgi:hypothetical protein